MDKSKVAEHYRTFRELIRKLHSNESRIFLKNLSDLIENNFENIITGLLFNRFNNNLKGKKDKIGRIISFLPSESNIEKSIVLPSLLTQVKDKIRRKLKETMEETQPFNSSTYLTSSLFRINIPIEPYTDTTKNYLFYYKHDEEDISENYVLLYQDHIIQGLERLYLKPNINRQVNLNNLQICSIDNFKKINTMDTISFANRDKLVDKLITGVREGRRLLAETDILLCYKARVIHDIIAYSPEFNDKMIEREIEIEEEEEAMSFYTNKEEEERKEEIKGNITKLLKSSVKQKDYNGFFTKEDYISFLSQKYFDCNEAYIESIFNKITTPHPPIGVTRFSVRLASNKELVYFISIENVAPLFLSYDFSTKRKKKKQRAASSLAMSERHFLLFLRKLIEDFRKLGYSDKDIAGKLQCSVKTVTLMDEAVNILQTL